MKKLLLFTMMTFILLQSGRGQSPEAQQLLLNWQKLQQLERILDNMYRGYTILDKGYNTVKGVIEGNYSLQQLFINGLMAVNPTIRNYRRVPLIISYQKLLLKEYQRAYGRFRQDGNFRVEELDYLMSVYNFLIDASLRNIEELLLIISASRLSMTDAERMEAIDRIFFDMEDKLTFLRTFNSSTRLLAIQRARSRHDVETMQKLYDIN